MVLLLSLCKNQNGSYGEKNKPEEMCDIPIVIPICVVSEISFATPKQP